MRKYELTIIADPSFTKAQLDDLVAEVKKEIERLDAKVGKEESLGKKELAYPIKKQSEGFFFVFPFEGPTDKIKGLEARLKIKEGLLRHLILASEE